MLRVVTPETFVESIRLVVLDAAARATMKVLRQPPGRAPAAELVSLSTWFNALPESDQEMVAKVAADAAHSAVFGFLCVLDGVRQIEDIGPKGEVILTYVALVGTATRLNDPPRELHDLL